MGSESQLVLSQHKYLHREESCLHGARDIHAETRRLSGQRLPTEAQEVALGDVVSQLDRGLVRRHGLDATA